MAGKTPFKHFDTIFKYKRGRLLIGAKRKVKKEQLWTSVQGVTKKKKIREKVSKSISLQYKILIKDNPIFNWMAN